MKGHFLEHHNRLLKYGFRRTAYMKSFRMKHIHAVAPKKGPLLNPSASDLLQSQQMPHKLTFRKLVLSKESP
jgi:hypothetical protein